MKKKFKICRKKIYILSQITAFKTYLIPVLNMLFICLPNPDEETINSVNEIMYDFLWNKKVKIKRNVTEKPFFKDGLKMVNLDLETFYEALLTRGLQVCLNNDPTLNISTKRVKFTFL